MNPVPHCTTAHPIVLSFYNSYDMVPGNISVDVDERFIKVPLVRRWTSTVNYGYDVAQVS